MAARVPDLREGDPSNLNALVAEALERLEHGGSVELERWAAGLASPRREAVLARVAHLQRLGFAPDEEDVTRATAEPERAAANGALEREGSIGPYRLLARLGAGGFGVVYLAEQHVPIHRRVALKLLRAGFETSSVLRRFAIERELLARFDHPAIAKVLDAGESAEGEPYLVVEFVAGEAITDFCRRRRLAVDERLALFREVCEGVQHAHQRGVIHRDLKPSNVLVMERDGVPAPKIIDFGLARALGGASREHAMTREGTLLGTLEYMSPEQAEGDADIDIRADGYALGVLLHELLVDDLPHGRLRWREASLGQQLEMIRSLEPARPSALAPSKELARRLAGDLDWIVLRALAKDRERRYRTVAELAEDLERHTSNRPVLAGPPSWSYVTKKFARRHRGEMIGGGLVLLSLVAALVYGAYAFRRLEDERASALVAKAQAEQAETAEREERERAEVLNRFLAGMLVQGNPLVSGTRVALSDVLARAEETLASGAVPEERTRLRLDELLMQSWRGLGRYAEAERAQARVLELVRRRDGDLARSTLRAEAELAWLRARAGRAAESLEALQRIDRLQRENGFDDEDTFQVRGFLAGALRELGRISEAEALYAEAIPGLSRTAAEPTAALTLRRSYALLLRETGRLAEALEALQAIAAELRELELEGRLRGGDVFLPALCASDLGSALLASGAHVEALPHLERALEFQVRWLGPEHEQSLATRNELAIAAKAARRFDLARRSYEELLPILRKQLGPHAKGTLAVQNNLAVLLQLMGELDDALALYVELVPAARAAFPAPHPTLATVLCGHAEALGQARRYEEAIALYVEGIEGLRRSVGAEHAWTQQRMQALNEVLRQSGDTAAAERLAAGVWPPR
ncbi:MAG: serine/threonine protein kinase [Planctomycetes bacterium]|nr:serine/threonine protein kinase [Planctomycetota bacterium]